LSNVFTKEITPDLIDIYFYSMRDFKIESIEKAMMMLVSEVKYFPKPAEIISLIRDSSVIQDYIDTRVVKHDGNRVYRIEDNSE
jgi:hypothetical protein